jgi:hypothetical protein
MSDITLVTLFYNIGRETWGLYPRKVVEYLAAFETFLEYDYKMIIFVDYRYFDELNEKVKNSKFNNKMLIPINEQWLLDNLWSWSKLEREAEIMQSTKYKTLVSHRIDRNYPENVNPNYTILTHSKIDVVNYVIDNDLTDDEYLAWVDFGYFYNKVNDEFLPKSTLDLNKFDLDKVNLCLINPIEERDKDIIYTLQYAPEKIGAYFFFANKSKFKEFQESCHRWLDTFQHLGIADDEQGIWIQCYFEDPELFKLHVFYKWHQALKVFSK